MTFIYMLRGLHNLYLPKGPHIYKEGSIDTYTKNTRHFRVRVNLGYFLIYICI